MKYEAFIKILEQGSFTKAAAQLGYTQSAISQMVVQLEQELGTMLLLRSRKGVSLTPDGEELLPFIRNIYHAQCELQKKKREMEGLHSGLIRIGTFSSVSSHFLPPLMKKFKALHPEVFFELHQSEYTTIANWIQEGTVDFGFTHSDTVQHLTTIPIFQDELLAVLPKPHTLGNLPAIPIKAIADDAFILVHEGEENDATKLFAHYHLQPNVQYEVHDDYTIMAMVEQELGIAILPELVLSRCAYDVLMKPLHPKAYRKIHLAYKHKQTLPRVSRAFIDFIVQHQKGATL